MIARPTRLALAVTGLCLSFAFSALAQIECWAPGMDASVVLNSSNGSKSVSLGKPYRYDVFGVAGTLELGNQAQNANVSSGKFRHRNLLGGNGAVVSSTGYVMLQTGLLNTYPQQLMVKGDAPGTSIGPIVQYGPKWTLSDPKNPAFVNLTFHTSGSSLLGNLLPGLLEVPYANTNAKGTFYVMGEYHATPPVMTGTLNIAAQSVLVNCPVSFSYSIEKHDNSTYRPPLLGVILQSVNLTVLGTPPPSAPQNQGSGGAQIAVTIDPNQIAVSIDLNSSQGNGWKKIPVTQ